MEPVTISALDSMSGGEIEIEDAEEENSEGCEVQSQRNSNLQLVVTGENRITQTRYTPNRRSHRLLL